MIWLLHGLGIDDTTGPWYAFWSGAGSDLGELALLAGIFGLYHRHNCHTKGCWRIGRHLVDGTPWCNKHHHAARERTI
jgi:hypothetical protein